MKLDRNLNDNGLGKYALLKLRKLKDFVDPADPFQEVAQPIAEAIQTLEKAGILDWGNTVDSEFMVIRLKDAYAQRALTSYALVALEDGQEEYGGEIMDMAKRSGANHPNCKKPD